MSLAKDALLELLKYHDDKYYNQDSPEISDAEYDALKKQYVESYGEYDYVPGEASADSIKYTHPVPVTSLDKVQVTEVDKLRKELERLWPVIIQPKMDGLTLVSYPDGKHVTRGNGKIGEVVTSKVNAGVEGLGTVHLNAVRSEVVMMKSKFEEINQKRIANGEEPFKNLRNAAAGMLRNKDITKVEGLRAFAYNLIRPTEKNDSSMQIEILEESGWNTVFIAEPKTIDEAIEFITTYNEKLRPFLDYEIDGLVIKHNGDKVFGSTGHHPKNAIAVKFEAEGDWTTINKITWQVGRTGKIVPVAELEPVEILNSTVTRATLHNYGIMKALGLTEIMHQGKFNPVTQVFVIKANDVIPAITEVKHPILDSNNLYCEIIHEPTSCPECNGLVEKINDQLFCTNPHCIAKLQGEIELMASRDALNIEGLSEATIEKMINYVKENELELFKPLNFTLPFYFSYENINSLPGFAPVSAKKLYDNIQKAKTTELKRFIYGSCIPLIGKTASEAMANTLLTVDNLIADANNDYKITATIQDFGPKMISSLRTYGNENFGMLWEAGVRPISVENVIKKADVQLTFVITGAFDIPRKEIETMIKNAGHKVSGSVSKKTSYLLASPGEESTTKYKKAQELDIKIIHKLEELEELI